VVTAHAIGGLAMASGLSNQSRSPSGAVEVMRRHVFIDTQLIHPALIRAAVDLLGADCVMVGSDWPIVDEGPIRDPVADAMRQAGLSASEQAAITSGNCRRLLGIH
jgi:predicted TIM-barrel fold metal-dependent hydrolase